MTDSTTTPPPAPTPSRPYAPPSLTVLGTVEAVTAGPDSGGAMDNIVGMPGGFTADSTS